jgi:hypothetical protein
MHTLYDLADYSKPISYFKDTIDRSSLDEQSLICDSIRNLSMTTRTSIDIMNYLHYDGISIANGKEKRIRYARLEEIKERAETSIFKDTRDGIRHTNLEISLITEWYPASFRIRKNTV